MSKEIEGYVVFLRDTGHTAVSSDVPRWYPKEFPQDSHWQTAECTWDMYSAMKAGHCGDFLGLLKGLGVVRHVTALDQQKVEG